LHTAVDVIQENGWMWGNLCPAVFLCFGDKKMDSITRAPDVRVKITRPNWKNETSLEEFAIVTFEPRPCTEQEKSRAGERWQDPQDYNAFSDALLSYSYSESRKNVDSPFNLSITPEEDLNGLTWLDKIAPFDLCYIEEFGKVRFCGVIHELRYGAKMGQDGATRTIMVSGNGFGELLKTFQMVLDVKLFLMQPASAVATEAKAEFISKTDQSLKSALDFYYDNFLEIISKIDEKQSVLKLLLEEKIDRSKLGDGGKTVLPMVMTMYQTGVNTIWDMWSKIVPSPMYELFGYWNTENKKYVLIARQNPFPNDKDENDWAALNSYKINPSILTEYNMGISDREVSTYFFATASSLGITNNRSLVVDNYKNTHELSLEKWKKYGYRPMNVELSFLKRDETDTGTILDNLNKIAKLLHSWYGRNDEFVSGTISIISYDDEKAEYPVIGYPAIGCRLEFLGGEFYIDEIQHRWTYGGSPVSELKVIRGYVYTQNGMYSGPIKNLGKKLKEFEEKMREAQNG
jgi:hypothetical protein